MNITIRRCADGFWITFRKGVPPIFVRSLSVWEGHPRDRVAAVIEKMWEYAIP